MITWSTHPPTMQCTVVHVLSPIVRDGNDVWWPVGGSDGGRETVAPFICKNNTMTRISAYFSKRFDQICMQKAWMEAMQLRSLIINYYRMPLQNIEWKKIINIWSWIIAYCLYDLDELIPLQCLQSAGAVRQTCCVFINIMCVWISISVIILYTTV